MKSTYEKPSEKKKRIKTENLKELKNNKIKKQVLILFQGDLCHKELNGSAQKGYGFIREEEKDRDIFLHVSELNSKLRVLKEDQILKFDIKEDKDKLQAINLKKI